MLEMFRSICNHQICKLCKGPGNLELCIAVRSMWSPLGEALSVFSPDSAHVINVYLPVFDATSLCWIFSGFLSQTWRASL